MLCLLCACSRNEGEEESGETTLSIYVYSPDNPLLTRGSTDWVNPASGKFSIKSLQIWVFEHETGNLVGYFTPSSTDDLNLQKSATYQMTVTPQFVHNKPNVDVYVLANIKNETCGCEFDEHASRADLEGAMLRYVDADHDYYGLSGTKVTSVPESGLPVSGKLIDQPVNGTSPVLHVGEENTLATVTLVRAVSKVRFVFSQQANEDAVLRVKGVSLKGDELLPKQEYLFLDEPYTGYESCIKTEAGYESGEYPLVGDIGVVASNEDPMLYVYNTQSAQEYEDLIVGGLANAKLTQGGLFYLRETDKRLQGEIRYTINDGTERTASFYMHEEGDFTRNHTWTVYAFYGTTTLEVLVVKLKDWYVAETVPHVVYNW